jgi:hypothetical protein
MGSVTLVRNIPVTEGLPLSSLMATINPDRWGEGEAGRALNEVQSGDALFSFEQVFGTPL